MYDRVGNSTKVVDEFFDVILELAAYAKKHLELSREIFAKEKEANPKQCEHAHRALLLGQEADYFLNLLELHNFDIFEGEFRRTSYAKVPIALYQASKAGRF